MYVGPNIVNSRTATADLLALSRFYDDDVEKTIAAIEKQRLRAVHKTRTTIADLSIYIPGDFRLAKHAEARAPKAKDVNPRKTAEKGESVLDTQRDSATEMRDTRYEDMGDVFGQSKGHMERTHTGTVGDDGQTSMDFSKGADGCVETVLRKTNDAQSNDGQEGEISAGGKGG